MVISPPHTVTIADGVEGLDLALHAVILFFSFMAPVLTAHPVVGMKSTFFSPMSFLPQTLTFVLCFSPGTSSFLPGGILEQPVVVTKRWRVWPMITSALWLPLALRRGVIFAGL